MTVQAVRLRETSKRSDLQTYARLAGALFVVLFVLGPISILYIPGQLVVANDPAATASNIAESEGLLRLAVGGDTLILLTEIAMSVTLFLLFRAVSRGLALATAAARLVQTAIMGANLLLYFPVLLLVGADASTPGLERGQRESLAQLALDTHGYGVYVGQAAFGFSLVTLGLLIRRARLVPRWLGGLMLVAAAGYLADSLIAFLTSDLETVMSVVVGVTALIGEVPFFLWLLFKGVNDPAADDGSGPAPVAASSV